MDFFILNIFSALKANLRDQEEELRPNWTLLPMVHFWSRTWKDLQGTFFDLFSIGIYNTDANQTLFDHS